MKSKDLRNYVVGTLGAAAFIVLAVWLVRTEGERTRRAIRQAVSEAEPESGGEVTSNTEKPIEAVGDRRSDGKNMDKDEAVAASKSVPARATKPAEDFELNDYDLFPGLSRSKPAARKAPPAGPRQGDFRPGNEGPPKKATEPAETVKHLFKLGHDASKQVDEIAQKVLGLSVEEERQVGREVHRLICRDHKVLAPPRLTKDLERLARPILELRGRKEITYSFFGLNDPMVNAFAHVGGYIYVSTGLVEFARNDTELQSVLAHEIAHVDLKHCSRQITYAARAAEQAGRAGFAIAQLAYMVVATGYNEQYEFEADEWAHGKLLRIGRRREESLSFLRRFSGYIKEHKLEPQAVRPRNVFESTIQEVQDHFRTHPPVEERLRRLEGQKPQL